jgi:hypothetical protein
MISVPGPATALDPAAGPEPTIIKPGRSQASRMAITAREAGRAGLVGGELDGKVATLLAALGATPPAELAG